MKVEQEVREKAFSAQKASLRLAASSSDERNAILSAMAQGLRKEAPAIIKANDLDMEAGRTQGMAEGLLDRLMIDESRIESMAQALEDLRGLEDPLGVTLNERDMYNDIHLSKVSVPLGVVAMVYEARPNVTVDAAGICIKTGNAVVLRGGSAAVHTNELLARVIANYGREAGMPPGAIELIATTDRSATDVLMSLHGVIDVLIPRGGTGLIRHCVENSKVPVIETGTGNCHIYVEATADFDMARNIAINAKCRRLGVCNAAETLLIDEAIAFEFLPKMLAAFSEQGVRIHGDVLTMKIAQEYNIEVIEADEHDWETEYLAAEIAVKCVTGVDAAIAHINQYGTKHSEAIITSSDQVADRFCKAVDAAAVYVNASTAFTDGGQFGMGAEIGISTQKLHARGPFALEALTSYKYILRGNGQVRDS